ncbi:hypothetical protein [Pseudoduganella sp. OTU4001]|uniref:hypothetical protein n=1 Tax=Pseudoduganella sp. OTU4001 TaxID=3043854 RepID=UPI00313A8E4B
MKTKIALAGLLCAAFAAQAAGPLYTTDHPKNPVPLRWDTSKPVPVYTDIGPYAFAPDGSVFIDNAGADKITSFALAQWSSVPTSTWRAVTDTAKFKKFDQVASIGGDVHDGASAELVYGKYNEGGMYVIYDQTGQVLEEYFGVPKDQVLGIAFAEFGEDRDGDGYAETITKATAVMNGAAVDSAPADPDAWWLPKPDIGGRRIAAVFTHEFGHAINLSHSQVNGHLGYFSEPYLSDMYPGVKGCTAPVHIWDYWDPSANKLAPKNIETMFPFLDSRGEDAQGVSAGAEQSTIDRPDDMAAISDIYPTASYLKTRGSIAGTLYLKDGRTPYSGINIIARNIADPLGDAVSAQSGDKTQGKLGPDGRFRINNLKPGAQYQLYIEEIVAGGYPTTPSGLVSVAEYWNSGESSDAAADAPCAATAITAEAGVTKAANFIFNGYKDGVQYTPLVSAVLTNMSKNGGRAGGVHQGLAFLWDANTGIQWAPGMTTTGASGSLSRDGSQMLVQADLDRIPVGTNWDGSPRYLSSAAIWNTRNGKLTDLGFINGGMCGGESETGAHNSVGFLLDGAGEKAVGLAYRDLNGDGFCQSSGGEIVPMVWTSRGGMRVLDMTGIDTVNEPWHRAQGLSGNGRVILGSANLQKVYAWVDEGRVMDLGAAFNVRDGRAMNYDGTRAALSTWSEGLVLWNPMKGLAADSITRIPQLKWCVDMNYADWFDSCEWSGAEVIQAALGPIPVTITDMSDDGKLMVGRAGDFWQGFIGVMWLDGIGWIKMDDFFRTQGVAEAWRYGMPGPVSVSGKGNEMVGGIPGYPVSWYVDMKKVHVCRNGQSQEVPFPEGFADAVKRGAQMGRCEFL